MKQPVFHGFRMASFFFSVAHLDWNDVYSSSRLGAWELHMGQKSHRFSPSCEKCQKSNGWIPKIAMEKGSYLFQTVIFGYPC